MTAYGTVRPRRKIDLVPQVSGRVVYVSPSLCEGGFFSRDEVLFRIEARDYELAVTQAEASVARARALLARERAEAEIAHREWEQFGRSEPNALALREPQLRQAEAGLASAEADRDRAQIDLARTVIHAPFDGRVRSKAVDVGQYLTAGALAATVYATDCAEVSLAIPESQIRFIDLPLTYSAEEVPDRATYSPPGVTVTLSSTLGGEERSWPGRIVRTEAEVDPRSRVIRCIALVEDPLGRRNSGRAPLLMGMYVQAEIPGRNIEGVVRLPRVAVRNADRVLVVDQTDRLRSRAVEVLRKGADSVWIDAGLEAGERVCVTPIEPVIEGMRVRVQEGAS